MNLTNEQKAKIFDVVFKEYVQEHGLGGMSKSDFNALLLFSIVSEGSGDLNSFELSNQFKITETQVKSLLELAAVKFDKTLPDQAWLKLLDILISIEYDIESLEKGQVRFQLKNPMLFRWLQEKVRRLGSTCSYSKSSEQVTINLDTLYKVLDILWKEEGISENWKGELLTGVQNKIQEIIGKIGSKIEINLLEDLRNKKQPKLRKIIENASRLASIGSLFISLLDKIQ